MASRHVHCWAKISVADRAEGRRYRSHNTKYGSDIPSLKEAERMATVRQVRKQLRPLERLTREPEHYFFGYYDLQPWSGDGRFHLCHRVEFRDRLPTAGDPAELGMINMADYSFIPLARTYAWNFQQGAMLQWHPVRSNDEIIFNKRLGERFKGVIRNIWTGEERVLSRPVASVDPNGRWALSINFSRLYDFRPGYGYAGIPDSFAQDKQPEEDGIFLVDLTDGTDRLLISYRQLGQFLGGHAWIADAKLLINHITFNTDGTRFVFLVRNFPMERPKARWQTAVLTAATDGSDIRCLLDFGMASHYWWRDARRLVIFAGVGEPAVNGLYIIDDGTGDAELIDPTFFVQDGHCSHSPDGQRILYDSYPDGDGYRSLYLYDLSENKGVSLAELRSEPISRLFSVDLRCDLHPRWSRDGSAISFDSVHESHRHVYVMDLK